jgi:EAL domain-containing protein (putative c-di-GMP-specific phosphodiesterase class I)/FixJ family two-component response regulator
MTPHGGRLLILEDDPGVGKLIQHVAVAGGHEARIVTQPEPFFAALDQWKPTHITLDLVMPELDGIQVLAELGERGCTAEIIITSGMGARVIDAAGRAAREHGLQLVGVLVKPFPAAALRALLATPAVSLPEAERHHPHAIGSRAGLSEEEFRLALTKGDFHVHYQPKISCENGRLVGFEALARWVHPQGHAIAPDQFIPFAERHGLINWLTDVVLNQSLQWFSSQFTDPQTEPGRAPIDTADPDISLSINLSARSLHDHPLVERIIACCHRYRVQPERIIFELTETSAMENPVAALDMLTRLRLHGFRLSIDDFGMGHSSMMQLVRMPFTEIKVDKSFVMSAAHSRESRAVVKSIVELGRSLGLKTAAEGVEDADALDLMRRMGCNFAQGYLIGRPMAADAIAAWANGRRGSAPAKAAGPRRSAPSRAAPL